MSEIDQREELSRDSIEPVERLRVSDSVAAQLERLIIRGHYNVGDKLPSERVLSQQFGVGRSSMREAIRGVESSGLVSSSHGIGVFVVSNTKRNDHPRDMLVFENFTIPDLFEVRLTLERDAAGFAAGRLTPAAADELQAIIDEASSPDVSDEEFVRLDVKLHQTIASASQNALLSQLYDTLEPLMLEYSERVISLKGRRAHAHESHVKIVDAIINKKVREAKAAAADHIRDVERDIAKTLKLSS